VPCMCAQQSTLKVFPTAADQPVRAAALVEVLQSTTLPKSLMSISSNVALSRSLLKLEQEVVRVCNRVGCVRKGGMS